MESYYRIRLPRPRSARRAEQIYQRKTKKWRRSWKKRRPTKMDEIRKRAAQLTKDINFYGPPFLVFGLIAFLAIVGHFCSRAGR